MELIPAFDPTMSTSGSFVASTLQTGSQIIITNKSYVNMIFTFASGDQRPVLANDRRAFTFGGASALPGPTIKWEQQSIDYPQTINQLENLVFVEVYAPTEIVTEKYPTVIQRETLPTLVPYNVGASIISTGLINPNTTSHTIWPSSYNGVTCAPQALGAVDGMGFDHYWAVFGPGTDLLDLPGNYPTTGKTAITTTTTNPSLITFLPGPFSKPGLTPVDSSMFANGAYWTTASPIPWSSGTTGTLIDCWVNLNSYPTSGNAFYLWGDDEPQITPKGVSLEVKPNGIATIRAGNGASHVAFDTLAPFPIDEWVYVAVIYNATTSMLEFYLNSDLIGSQPFTGPIATTTFNFGIANDTRIGASSSTVGSVTNVGILLSNPYSTQWGSNIVAARYLLGLQSLNVDMQNVWLQGFDLYTYEAPTTFYTYSLSNIQNTAGLLYRNTQINDTQLHVKQPGNIFGDFIIPQQTNQYVGSFRFPTPITHLPAEFMSFNDWVSTGPQYAANFYGYNILGFS